MKNPILRLKYERYKMLEGASELVGNFYGELSTIPITDLRTASISVGSAEKMGGWTIRAAKYGEKKEKLAKLLQL